MGEEIPAKRRRTENLNDLSRNVEINKVSVKPDKFQKLRRIAASCTEKIQAPKYDDVVVISSVGSSPSSSPRPERLAGLSNPVDPAELHARLTVLVQEEDKENQALESGDGHLKAGNQVAQKELKISAGKNSETVDPNDERHSTRNVVTDKNMNIPMSSEEFRVLLSKMINEKMKKLEEYYTDSVIPDLEKKIVDLESENKRLLDVAKQVQDSLAKAIEAQKKRQEKPAQCHVGVQASSNEPPPLTPVTTAILSVTSPSEPPVVHIDSIPGLHKPPSTTIPHVTQASTIVNGDVSLRAVSMTNGIRHTAVNTGGHVYTTMSGQPRMYSDAPYQPGSHPNAIVTPRPHAPFARPSGTITATVYPQPQNLPTPPSTLGVHRITPPTPHNQSPPNRYQYNPQTPNGITIRSRAQVVTNSKGQYVVAERDNPVVIGAQLGARHRLPTAQGPPPSYSVATAIPQQQVAYHPGPAANTVQVNGVRHYGVRHAAPPPLPVANQVTPVRAPGPPPLVRTQSNILQQQRPQVVQNSSPSYPGPRAMNQRPSYPQNSPTQVANDPNQIRIQQAAAVTPRHHGVPPNVPPPPSQPTPTQNPSANGIVRDRPPPTPTVSISGASNGIVLSWNMTIPEGCAPIDSYQLFAYQNSGHAANSPSLWKKLGIVKALPLPMACTLTQFVSGSIYYFAVRAIDIHGRAGNYSAPCAITLPNESEKGRT